MINLNHDESIKLNQGDSGFIAIAFDDYCLSEADKILFVVKDKNDIVKIRKEIEIILDGVAYIEFFKRDTYNLAPGEYNYFLGLRPKDIAEFTLVCNRKFEVERGVLDVW